MRTWFLLFLLSMGQLSAHQMGLSALTIDVGSSPSATLLIAQADVGHLYAFDQDGDDQISKSEFDAKKKLFGDYVSEACTLTLHGKPIEKTLTQMEMPDSGTIRLIWKCSVPPGGGELKVRSEIFESLPATHRQMVLVQRDGAQLGTAFIDKNQPEATFSITGPAHSTLPIHQFVLHGMEHIFTGWDHILFIVALLMTGAHFKNVLKIVTAFTVSHSVTLALAVFHIIQVSPRIIEPSIALSIGWVAIENLRNPKDDHRWILAGTFGFIHGFGFASAAVELFSGMSRWQLVPPLISFNVGIESGQIVIAAICLPVIWKVKDSVVYRRRFLPAASVVIALVAVYLFIDRLKS